MSGLSFAWLLSFVKRHERAILGRFEKNLLFLKKIFKKHVEINFSFA